MADEPDASAGPTEPGPVLDDRPTEERRIDLLASYVPAIVRRRIVAASSAPTATDGQAERLSAAVLLVDISGFTPLTAAAARRGSAGTEALSRSLNEFFARIIDLVDRHGGDVAKVIGDAIVAIWPADSDVPVDAVTRAATCGLALASELAETELEDDVRLSLKVGLCAGPLVVSRVGGLDDRWLSLLAGDAVSGLVELEPRMETGTLVATSGAWQLIADRFVGQPRDAGYVRVRAASGAAAIPTTEAAPAPPADPDRRGDPGSRPIDERDEAALRAYAPPVSLRRIDAGQSDWLAELRRTTVVFAAVRGVGATTDDDLDRLTQVTRAAQQTIKRYDGWLKEVTVDDKGTTLVAVFGVPPASHEDDPSRGIEAGLALRDEIRRQGLSAGIGIATGPTFCGPIGDRRRRDFVVLGQHVNLASRLMQAAGDDGLLCDIETHGAAGSRRPFERLPAYVLKGMAAPIDVFRVRPADAGTGQTASIIDRRTELAEAVASLDALRAGSGGVVVLEGEPGIGKSRLVEEIRRAATESRVRTLTGTAEEIEEATPYFAWRTVFERLLGIEGLADLTDRRERVLGRLGDDGQRARMASLLDPILSLDLRDSDETAALPGETRADNTRDLLVGILREETAELPLLVVLEDVHWLDSASWSLVSRVVHELSTLLLVLTSRPIDAGPDDPLGVIRDRATTVHLGPLARADALTLACERTGATTLADSVAAVVNDRAEGNPLFIEQLTFAMRDSGRIVVERGVLRAASESGELVGSLIPDTVQRVITTRLDQLPPAEAMTLKVASVIGQRFAIRTLAEIYPLPVDRPDLMDHLATLQRLDLVAEARSAPEPTFEFRHVITQEVAYNLMLASQSSQLHERLAAWYEETYAADLSPFHALLAYHWRRAGQPARAVGHLEAAGLQALRTFANEEAIGFLEQGLAVAADAGLALDPARRARWELALGESYVHMSRYREGRPHLETGLRLMGRAVPGGRTGQVVSLLGQVARQGLRRVGLGRSTRDLSDQDRDDLVASFRALERLAEASYYNRETLTPLYCVVRILNDAEASGIPAEISRGFAGTGALFGVVPLPRVAEWYLRRASERLGEVDDLTTHEIVGISIGFYHIGAGHWDEARERFRIVRRTARRLGDRRRLDDAVGNLMELEYLRGSFRTALEHADEMATSAAVRNDRRFLAEAYAGTAYSALQLGETDVTTRAGSAIRSLMSEGGEFTDELRLRLAGLQALTQLGRGDRAQALAASDEAMRLTAGQRPTYFGAFLGHLGPAETYLAELESQPSSRDARARSADALGRLRRFAGVFPFARPRSLLLQGRYRMLTGDRRGALDAWRRAVDAATALDMPYERGLAALELGSHLEPSDLTRSEHLDAARRIFAELGTRPALEMVEALAGSAGRSG